MENLTALEKIALKVLCDAIFGDTDFDFKGIEQTGAWFGSTEDADTRELFKTNNITGKSISGVVSSLVQKGIIAVESYKNMDFKTYYYIPNHIYKQN